MPEFRVKFRSNYLGSTIDLDIIMPNPFVGHDPEKRYLEPYRDMAADEFCGLAQGGGIPSACGSRKGRMTTWEINSIRKYGTVGEFLDSYENSMARFLEAAEERRLPRIYMAGSKDELGAFRMQAESSGISNITFALTGRFITWTTWIRP